MFKPNTCPSNLSFQEDFKNRYGVDLVLQHAHKTHFQYHFIIDRVGYALTIRSFIDYQLVEITIFNGICWQEVVTNFNDWRNDAFRLVNRVIDREVTGCNR